MVKKGMQYSRVFLLWKTWSKGAENFKSWKGLESGVCANPTVGCMHVSGASSYPDPLYLVRLAEVPFTVGNQVLEQGPPLVGIVHTLQNLRSKTLFPRAALS